MSNQDRKSIWDGKEGHADVSITSKGAEGIVIQLTNRPTD